MAFDLSGLIEQYKAPESFDVTLPAGEVFTFRAIKSHAELVDFRKRAGVFVKAATSRALIEAWKEFAPIPAETALIAFTVSELSLEPKIEQLDALTLAKNLPWVLETMYEQIELNRSIIFNKAVSDNVEAGKDE